MAHCAHRRAGDHIWHTMAFVLSLRSSAHHLQFVLVVNSEQLAEPNTGEALEAERVGFGL